MFVPRRILIAPSGFKGSLDACDVARSIAAGVRRTVPGCHVRSFAVPDGGEGTAEILAHNTGGTLYPARVTGPVGELVDAHWALLGGPGPKTAVVEMAAAAGLSRVPEDMRDPGATTTRGVGELIAAALDHGVERIVVGCGDSGTCDGGAGALSALGAALLDADGNEVPDGGSNLEHVARIDLSGLHPRLAEVPVELACNIHNVLCGPSGVARVFGPQKGATPEMVDELDRALDHWAGILERDGLAARRGRADVPDLRRGGGTGASGGLGAGLAGGLGARLRSRFDVLISPELIGADLRAEIEAADLVITAEGAIDFQTPKGKVPAEIAGMAADRGVPVVALAGSLGEGAPDVHDIGVTAVASIMTIPMTLPDAVRRAEKLLVEATERVMRTILAGSAMASLAEARQPTPLRTAV